MTKEKTTRELTLAQKNIMREDLMWDPVAWEGIEKIANIFMSSGAVPKSIQNAAQMVMILQAGRELGIRPTESMRQIHLINGKIGLEGRLLQSKMRDAGVDIKWTKRTDAEVSATFTYKKDGRTSFETSFTKEDATAKGFMSKDTYKNYFKEMASWKCIHDAAKFFCPDLIGGLEVREVLEYEDAPQEKLTAAQAATKVIAESTQEVKKPEPAQVVEAEVVEPKDEPKPEKGESGALPTFEDIIKSISSASTTEELETVRDEMINNVQVSGDEGREINRRYGNKLMAISEGKNIDENTGEILGEEPDGKGKDAYKEEPKADVEEAAEHARKTAALGKFKVKQLKALLDMKGIDRPSKKADIIEIIIIEGLENELLAGETVGDVAQQGGAIREMFAAKDS